MRRVAVLVVALLAASLSGCGNDGGRADGGDPGRTDPGRTDPGRTGPGGGLTLEVGHDPERLSAGSAVTWLLTVRNRDQEAVTLTFSSGQDGDVTLRGGAGEAYRWSGDRFFTEAVRHVTLAAGEEQVFRLEERILAVRPGDYELVAELASDPAPDAERRTVTVDGPP